MTHPERQQDPFDTPSPASEWKNFEALERELAEIRRRLAVLEAMTWPLRKLRRIAGVK